jgi:hypothetical protein
LHGIKDASVSGATTDISGQCFFDLSSRWLRIRFQKIVHCHNEPWGAEPTLHATSFNESLLDVRERFSIRETLHSGDGTRSAGRSHDEARTDGVTVEQHRARTAFALFAGALRPGESEPLAQDVQE